MDTSRELSVRGQDAAAFRRAVREDIGGESVPAWIRDAAMDVFVKQGWTSRAQAVTCIELMHRLEQARKGEHGIRDDDRGLSLTRGGFDAQRLRERIQPQVERLRRALFAERPPHSSR